MSISEAWHGCHEGGSRYGSTSVDNLVRDVEPNERDAMWEIVPTSFAKKGGATSALNFEESRLVRVAGWSLCLDAGTEWMAGWRGRIGRRAGRSGGIGQ